MTKEDVVETVVTEPVLECRHGSEQRCHNTYLTEFQPASHQAGHRYHVRPGATAHPATAGVSGELREGLSDQFPGRGGTPDGAAVQPAAGEDLRRDGGAALQAGVRVSSATGGSSVY